MAYFSSQSEFLITKFFLLIGHQELALLVHSPYHTMMQFLLNYAIVALKVQHWCSIGLY